MINKIINLPDEVKYCINKLQQNGYDAFAVGGCVRDCLLNKTPKDYDVTTSALPEQVMDLFEHTIPTGIKFGTVMAVINNMPIEITTFRSESNYIDFRRPESVDFAGDIYTDLSRRDFTINAMAYSDSSGIVDPFNGMTDLNNKIIKAVGNPLERFNEDALRIMRAFRFALRLGFDIDSATFDAAITLSGNLKKISVERIASELLACLITDHPSDIKPLLTCDSLNFIGLSGNFKYDINMLDKIINDKYARLAAFIIICDSTNEVCKNLKLDNITIKNVKNLLDCYKHPIPKNQQDVCHLFNKLNPYLWKQWLNIKNILLHDDISNCYYLFNYVIDNNIPYKVSMLNINGDILISKKIVDKGKQVGYILNELLNKVIDNPELNNKNTLIRLAYDLIKEI